MIKMHRLNGSEIVVNAELIEHVEPHGEETVIIMATNNRIVVRENVTQVIQSTVEYRQRVGLSYVPRPLRRADREKEEESCH